MLVSLSEMSKGDWYLSVISGYLLFELILGSTISIVPFRLTQKLVKSLVFHRVLKCVWVAICIIDDTVLHCQQTSFIALPA